MNMRLSQGGRYWARTSDPQLVEPFRALRAVSGRYRSLSANRLAMRVSESLGAAAAEADENHLAAVLLAAC
jgi:hypothetical protein